MSDLAIIADGSPNKDDTSGGYSYGRDAYPKQPEGPIAHILLGGQIIFVAATILGGFGFLGRAVGNFGGQRKGEAVFLYAVTGSLSIVSVLCSARA